MEKHKSRFPQIPEAKLSCRKQGSVYEGSEQGGGQLSMGGGAGCQCRWPWMLPCSQGLEGLHSETVRGKNSHSLVAPLFPLG